MKIKNIKSFKKKTGFTLIELLLSISFVSVASAVIYNVYAKADDMRKIENELRTIATFMSSVDSIASTRGSFTGISTETLDSFGLKFNSGLKNALISTPSPNTIDIKYSGISERLCSGLVMQAEGKLGTLSEVKLKANGVDIESPIKPIEAAKNCSKDGNKNDLVVSLKKHSSQAESISPITQNQRPAKIEPTYPQFGVNVSPPTFAIPEAPDFLAVLQPPPGEYVPPPPAPTPPIPEFVPGTGSSTPPNSGTPEGGIGGSGPSGAVGGSGGGNFGVNEGLPDGYLEITEVCLQTRYVIHQTTASYEELVVVEGPSPTLCMEFEDGDENSGIQNAFLLDWVDAYIQEDAGNGYYVPTFYSAREGGPETFQNAHTYLLPYITKLQLQGAQLPPGQRFNNVIPSCTRYNYFLNQTGPRVYFPETGNSGLNNPNYPPTVVTQADWQTAPKGNNTLVLYVDKEKQSDCN